jgi:Fe-S oxidoreductase
VREALDWCLACKGCRSDCPTHTDMAAYKAEFLSHYYETHRRPRQAWSMGRIGEWAPLASKFAGIANFASSLAISRCIAGVAPDRKLPKFAARTFRSQFKASGAGAGAGDAVVLFDDTFNNHFRPGTAAAAHRLLARTGCAVELPARRVCCGRPYYDYGMLDEAKRALEHVLEVLPTDRPIVVLEPGCLSVFRDEMRQLLPDDARAARVAAQVTSLSEFLNQRNFRAKAPARVLVHSHCHQKALWGASADVQILRNSGCEVLAPDTGCCGMAGSFGYRPQHAAASRRIAELALLPALEAAGDAVVVANGFSCREQIEALTGRPTLHVAELLR